jgi:hypothetical protein
MRGQSILKDLGSEFNHQLDSEIVSRLVQIYRTLDARHAGADYSVQLERIMLDVSESLTWHLLKDYLWTRLAALAQRSDLEGKRQVARLILEEFERAISDSELQNALQALHDLELDSSAIPKGIRTRILALLEHKDWSIADAAFEVAVRYELI